MQNNGKLNCTLNQQLRLIARPRINKNRDEIRMLTHDLVSPLTVIKLNLDLLALNIDRKQVEIERIYKGLDHIEQLIDNGLHSDSNLEEGGKRKINKGWFVNDVIKEVLSLNSISFDNNKVKVITKFFDDKYFNNIPSSHLFRVVNNITNNAIHALLESKNPKKYIWISTIKDVSGFKIIIRDNGKGIPKNIQQHLFKRNITTKRAGHGIGLLACSNILKTYLNGSINYRDNELAKTGAVFEIILNS